MQATTVGWPMPFEESVRATVRLLLCMWHWQCTAAWPGEAARLVDPQNQIVSE